MFIKLSNGQGYELRDSGYAYLTPTIARRIINSTTSLTGSISGVDKQGREVVYHVGIKTVRKEYRDID